MTTDTAMPERQYKRRLVSQCGECLTWLPDGISGEVCLQECERKDGTPRRMRLRWLYICQETYCSLGFRTLEDWQEHECGDPV